jgi:hypothetical protein
MSENTEIVVKSEGGAMNLKQITDRVNLVQTVLEKVMIKGTHYGTVPGCGTKMVLLKPGADVLAMTFRLVPQFAVTRTMLENGHREYDVTCSMYGADGSLLGQGVGSASSMEKKYRYRKDADGNKIENEDIADCYNTVLKIAKKRAHIDATLTVTGAADLFTQDLIDEEEAKPDKPAPSMPTEQPEPAPSNADQFASGILDDVVIKTGTKNNKPWTKYGLVVDGQAYGTFDAKIGKLAEELKGQMVVVTWMQDGKFRNALEISLAAKE